MSSYSPYVLPQDESPIWLPGEEEVTASFIAITFYMAIELNFQIFRSFKTRRGLYFWSVEIGSWAIAVTAISNALKFLVPNSEHLWILITILNVPFWCTYVTAQSLVLYSRLHLVNRNPRVLRLVLVMIISTLFTFQLPTWICVWPAYSPNPTISSVWSPRLAIMERYEQLGYSVVETIISGIYIFSISKLLKNKSGIRQRRVLRDLIYVNITVIACDIVLVTLTFTNQVDVSLAVQDFSYMLKLKLEFVVLNQLMAVAARGLSGETYAEKRYYHPSSSRDNRSAWSPDNAKHPLASSKRSGDSYQSPEALEMDSYPGGPEIRTPSPVVPRAGLSPPHPIWESQAGGHSEAKRGRHPPGVGIAVSTHSDQDNRKPRANAQSDTQAMLEPPEGFPVEEASRLARWSKSHKPLGKKSKRTRGRHDEDEDEEQIGLHMWENRGKLILKAPWFEAAVGS